MSYYQGDYYQGDPFFGALIKGVGKLALGGIKKLIGVGATRAPMQIAAAPQVVQAGRQIIRRIPGAVSRVIQRHPVISAAAAAGTVGAIGGAVAGAPGVPMRGFHISARTGELVRNRRMRVTNPRALRRAIRRATGFARLARRVLSFTSPRAPRGRAIFKRKRARRV